MTPAAGFALLAACLMVGGGDAAAQGPASADTSPPSAMEWRPRILPAKPERTEFRPLIHQPDVLVVKFRDDLPIRVHQGRLTDQGKGTLDVAQAVLQRLAGASWSPGHQLDEARLDELRANAQTNLRRRIADLNTEFILKLPPDADAAETCDALNALDIVELAEPMPRPAPLTLPPDFEPMQGYLSESTGGINAQAVWNFPGGTAAGLKVADIEYNWNFNHQDLSPITLIGPQPVDPFSSNNHGTAVLGQLGSLPNGWGTTGIAYDAAMYVVAANTSSGYNVGAAITRALTVLGPGDVILIEQQFFGPNYTGQPPGTQFGLVPSEWSLSVYNATLTAVGNGVIVVAAAGNGSQDLDDPVYHQGHAPFRPENDSGAIIVGGGAPPGHGNGDRSRLSFSNYGSRVNLQGWGAWVTTTGYGGLYSAEGVDLWYTSTFSGTSSASPIVAGACLLLQSTFVADTGTLLTPVQVRDALRSTGSPQLSGTFPASQHIGPRPDVLAALLSLSVVGACCQGTNCDLTTAGQCENLSGTFCPGTTCSPSTCDAPPPPTPEPDGIHKNRFISLVPPDSAQPMTIRVRLTGLPPAFASFENEVRWVGAPVASESGSHVAGLRCEPHCALWAGVDVLHVFGAEIVPGAEYEVQMGPCSCDPGNNALFSPALSIATGVWGDVASPFESDGGPVQPDIADISALVTRFSGSPEAIPMVRAKLQPNVPLPGQPIDITDIARGVDAFQGLPYPYGGPCACPVLVQCGQFCTEAADCGGGLCIDNGCRDACGRCSD